MFKIKLYIAKKKYVQTRSTKTVISLSAEHSLNVSVMVWGSIGVSAKAPLILKAIYMHHSRKAGTELACLQFPPSGAHGRKNMHGGDPKLLSS